MFDTYSLSSNIPKTVFSLSLGAMPSNSDVIPRFVPESAPRTFVDNSEQQFSEKDGKQENWDNYNSGLG